MRRSALLIVFAALTAWAQAPKAAIAPAKPPNAVQLEMQALHELMVTSLVAIENGKTDVIPAAIHKVHDAKGVTEKAITSGAWKPPRTDATVADFVKTDEAFHDELVKLLRASKQNDVTATTRQLGAVLDGCTSCHMRFRFPAALPPKVLK
jgi:cytochrome c556